MDFPEAGGRFDPQKINEFVDFTFRQHFTDTRTSGGPFRGPHPGADCPLQGVTGRAQPASEIHDETPPVETTSLSMPF